MSLIDFHTAKILSYFESFIKRNSESNEALKAVYF